MRLLCEDHSSERVPARVRFARSARGVLHRQSLFVFLGCVLMSLTLPFHAGADSVTNALQNGRDFRVRVAAALRLGGSSNRANVPFLVAALADAHPAVRASAVTGLARLGDPAALPALRRLTRDSSPAVRQQVDVAIRALSRFATASVAATVTEQRFDWNSIRYVVVLGDMRDQSDAQLELSGLLRNHAVRALAEHSMLAVIHDHASGLRINSEANRRHLPRMRIEGALSRLSTEMRPLGSPIIGATLTQQLAVHAEVSFLLLQEPSRNMRGSMRGAATGTDSVRGAVEPHQRRLADHALLGAVRTALSRTPAALAQAIR